ncbi:MAG: beta-ketoacyl-[acyl-carrier-protein] synthase II [Candidatus Neomarinimicrobiota bacterium]|nr:MAG: beta-ketoacyl-[acyl-carrier-protein] synthase II [Candidatus Neomarinimicrobiota bacterium]
MKHKRIVVTGLGVLAPNGNGVAAYWNALLNGVSGIDRITYFDPGDYPVQIAGELKDFHPETILEPTQLRKLDPFTIFALVSAQEAWDQSGLNINTLDPTRIGVSLGTGVGGIQTLEDQHTVISNRGSRRVSPHFVPKMIANIAGAHLSIRFGLQGPNQTVTSACASATDAIGIAARILQYGDADVMLCGGSEASITPLTIAGFGNMKALSKRNDPPQAASRPFDKDRDGFVLGEGAGILVLETLDHARKRSAPILAELAGYGASDDAFHVTQPSQQGPAQAMARALQDAELNPEDVDYVNAHGTSTPYNDKNETAAIRSVFGTAAERLHISSTKSMTGHLLGASGGIEAVATVKSLQEQVAPPTINYTTPDPECDLQYIPNTPREFPIRAAISNSFGFGGHNGVLLFTKWN